MQPKFLRAKSISNADRRDTGVATAPMRKKVGGFGKFAYDVNGLALKEWILAILIAPVRLQWRLAESMLMHDIMISLAYCSQLCMIAFDHGYLYPRYPSEPA